jgi:DNA-binding transcriptional ArsR family regulator
VLYAHAGTMTAGELAARFSHSWPTTTRHLGVLVGAGLLRVRREGRERRYVLDRERLGAALRLWLESVGFTVAEQPRPTRVRDAPDTAIPT